MQKRGILQRAIAVVATSIAVCSPSVAQVAEDETLADIRRQMFNLYGSMEHLRLELLQTEESEAGLTFDYATEDVFHRIDVLEYELRQAISKIEELEFRILRIAEDGTRQLRDLEFQLVELGGGDLSSIRDPIPLGDATSQGPSGSAAVVGSVDRLTNTASEQRAFDLAVEAYKAGDYLTAHRLFLDFSQAYALSELNADAHYFRADSLLNVGDPTGAAKAFLDSYRLDQSGETAPRALYGLAVSLTVLGRDAEACRMHEEILSAFPESPESAMSSQEIESLICR